MTDFINLLPLAASVMGELVETAEYKGLDLSSQRILAHTINRKASIMVEVQRAIMLNDQSQIDVLKDSANDIASLEASLDWLAQLNINERFRRLAREKVLQGLALAVSIAAAV